jgi:dihydroflavonol-4-reductase
MDNHGHILVTGASGFVGSHVTRELLERGYHVRGTVRSLQRTASYAHLLALPGAERLDLVEADLTVAGSFDEAVVGMSGVIHTASPYALDVDDPQRDLVDPAVNGTREMLGACLLSPTVTRVVVTSSMAAITDEPDSAHVLTEADWNTRSTLQRNPYYLSKAAAERAAWEFMDAAPRSFDLVVVNPYLIIGPEIGPGINTSNQVLVDMTNGTYPAIMALAFGFVDVRDVATAHVLALGTPSAHGRYICAGDVVSMREVVGLMREQLPAAVPLPTRGMDNALGTAVAKLASRFQPAGVGSYLRTHLGRTPRYDNSRIQRDLGLRFRPARDSIRDTVDDLVAGGDISIA